MEGGKEQFDFSDIVDEGSSEFDFSDIVDKPEKKNLVGNATPNGGKVGASETPSTGSSPFLQRAKERVEQGAPTVLSVKKETVKEVGLPSYTPTKEEELKAPTQKQFEQQTLLPTYQKESALDISKKQTQVAIERSKALDELIKTKKEAQSSYEKIRNLDNQIESFEPQFEKFKTTAEAFQPDIQEYKNLTSQIAEIKNKSNSFVLEYNNEYQKLAPKLEAYKQIFENEKLPNEKRQDAYENYNGIVSILKNKEKLLDQAIAQNEQGIGDLEARAKSFDETIKKATANQAGFSQLYSQYKSLIDERNKSAEGLGVYEKRMSDAQNQIKQKLFEQSQLEDVRQQKLEKEYSTWQNFFESLPKMGIEAVAGVADMLNVLGFSGDPESPETRDEVKKETRQNIEKLRKFGDSFITQELPKNYEKLFEGQFSLKKLANVGFNAIASTAPTIAAGLIGGPAAGVAAGAGMAFGESKEIMKEAGLTEEQAEAAAFGLSIPIGLLENYGAEDIVKLFSKEAVEYSTKIFLKNIAGRTLTKEQLFNEAKNTIGQIIKDGAPQLLKEGVKESGTEVSQGAVNEVAKQVAQEFTGVDLDENMSWSDYLKEQAEVRGEEAIGGFIGGTSMQTIGLGLKSAGEGIFPTFNPSAYQKALELLDPSKMEAFSQEVQQEVQDKVLTQEQADLAFRNIQLIQETNKLIPATINNKDLRTEALNLLIEKKETQKEIEGKDDALVAPQKARIEEINKRLSDIANGKEEEVVTPTVKLNKNTTPTEEKYGTIDRGDGKGVVDLTRAEYEAELAKQGGEVKPMVTEVQFATKQRERRDQEIEEVQQLRNDLGQDVELINDIPGFVDDVVDRMDLGMMVAPEMLSDAIKELDKQFDKLQAYRNDPARTHTTAQIDAMIDVLGAVKSEIQDYQIKQQENEQQQPTTATQTEPTAAPTEGVEAGQEQVKEAVSVSDKKADIENQVEKIQKALDNEEYGHGLTGNTGAYITGTALDIDFTKEELEKYNNLYKKYPEKIVNDEDVNWEERKKEKDKLIREILERGLKETKQKLAALKGTQTQSQQVTPTTQEEKGKSSVPSKTDKAYQEAQGVTERVSKAHPEASVLVLPKGNDLSLTALYVGKEKRGKGIGSGVLESVKAEADKLGKKVVLDATNELDNDTDLERLGEFYERNGFVKVGENKFEYTPNINQNKAGQEQVTEPLKDVESTAKALEGVDKIKLLSQSGLIDKSERTSYKSYNVGDVISGNQLDELSGDLVGNQPNKKFVLVQTSLSNFSENREQLLKEEKGYEEEEADRLESMKENFNKTPPIPMQGDGRHRIISAKELGHKTILMWQEASSKSISEAYHADKAAGKETELTKAVEQLLTPNINQNETVNENVREIGNGQKDGQKGDVSQEAKSDVQEGEEKVAEGEEPTAEQVDKASKAVGTTPSNLRDLYRISRDLFGQSKDRALASAIAMDRMIGAMAKRAGILKQRMYEKLQFRKDTEANVLKADNALFQGMVDGKPVTLRNMDVDVVNGFYSPIEKNLMEYGKDKIKAKDWLNVVGKSDEAVFTGVRAFLEGKDPNAMVSKQEILDYMKDNRISVVEVVKGKQKVNKSELELTERPILGGWSVTLKSNGKKIDIVSKDEASSLEEAKEVAFSRIDEQGEDTTKFSRLQLEGEKENYKEVLITLPNSQLKSINEYNDARDELDAFERSINIPTEEDKLRYSELSEKVKELEGNLPKNAVIQQGRAYVGEQPFKSTHFDEPNILVHLRMNTRTDADGNKVLFLEEVQSDWGQTGKKEGFEKPENTQAIEELKNEKQKALDSSKSYQLLNDKTKGNLTKDLFDAIQQIATNMIDNPYSTEESRKERFLKNIENTLSYWSTYSEVPKMTQEELSDFYDVYIKELENNSKKISGYGTSYRLASLENKIEDINKKIYDFSAKKGVPTAPFVMDTNAWTKLGLKVALKEAVAQGVDKIAWTTGEQQNDRYDLSKQVKKIEINQLNDGTFDVTTTDLDGEEHNELMRNEKELSDYVGKEIADKVINEGKSIFSGDGLKLGGKGMKGFYGSMEEGTKGIVGGVAEKLFGQKIGTVEVEIGRKKSAPIESVTLNGESVKEKSAWASYILDYNKTGKSYTIDAKKLSEILDFHKKQLNNAVYKISEVEEFINSLSVGDKVVIESKSEIPTSTQPSIDITPALRAEVIRGLALFQRQQGQQAKGAMVAADGIFIIYALFDPNVSTPLHEMAHVFEHYLTESERQTIIRNAGTGAWTTETSEYFARGFEKYLAEGVAPNKELQKVFEKFKEWLTEIYNGITGSEIDIQLNDEMRAIYAQMFGEENAKPITELPKTRQERLDSLREKAKKLKEGKPIFFSKKPKEKIISSQEDIEKNIVDEMNNMELVNQGINLSEATSEQQIDVEELNSRLDTSLESVNWEDYEGVPFGFTISDQLRSGDAKNTYTGETIKDLKGGIGFNGTAGNENKAWANTTKDEADSMYEKANSIYEKNKPLFEKLWAEGKLPQGVIPFAVVKMAESSILSNEAVFRAGIQNIETLPKQNREAAVVAIKKELERKIEKESSDLKRGTVLVKDKKTGEMVNTKEPYSSNTLKQKKKAIGQYQNILNVIKTKGYRDIVDVLKNKTDFALPEKAIIANEIFYGNPTPIGGKEISIERSRPSTPVSLALIGDKSSALINIAKITDMLTEPSMKDVPNMHIVSIVGVKVADKVNNKWTPAGGSVKTNHPNYKHGVEGQSIGILKNPVHMKDAFGEAYGSAISQVVKNEAEGKSISSKSALSQGVPVQSGLPNRTFISAIGRKALDNVDKLNGFLRQAFPSTTFFTSQEAWDAAMQDPDVYKKLQDGDVVYAFTKNGNVFINPNLKTTKAALHEVGHIWMDFIKENNPKLFEKGLKLVEGTQELKDAIAQYGDNLLAREEALMEIMSTKGDNIVNAAQKAKVKEWLLSVWKYVSEKFESLKGLTPKQIEDLTLDKFVEGILSDILSGKEITTKSLKGEGKAKFSAADPVSNFISSSIEEGYPLDEVSEVVQEVWGKSKAEVNELIDKYKTAKDEKITQKEDGKPLPEGVSGVRAETEERKTSPELRPQEEEVRSIIDNAVANFYAINEATKRSEKREAAKEYRQNLEKMPTVKNIFDNIKTIFAQLEAEGIITKSKDCP